MAGHDAREDEDDYVRRPIPNSTLVRRDGSALVLHNLAVEHPALLVLVPPPSEARAATLARAVDWSSRLSRVVVVPVLPDLWRPIVPPGVPDNVIFDPERSLAGIFETADHLAAVLLGVDGLLAGGPVLGISAIDGFVDDIAEALEDPGSADAGAARQIPISAKCITYGRVEYLEESLASFLQQDYVGEHELVIVNDYPLQTLHFDHPRVRIFNLDFTFRTIGEKENFAVSACRYDTIAVWDDDDIALPNHLANIDRFMRGHDLLHWQRGAAWVGEGIESLGSLGNSGIVYSRRLWDEVGGHAHENAGYDVTFVNRLLTAGAPVVLAEPPAREVSWFYMWGNGSYHMSGLGTDDGSRPHVVQRHADHIEALRQQGVIPTGDVELVPRWRRDYAGALRTYCDEHNW